MYTSPSVVFGFHGCDQTVSDKVLKNGDSLALSEKSYDWLGHGIYFWEGSESRALEWAKSKNDITKPAVIGAVIRLGNCLDLLNDQDIKQLATTYKILDQEFKAIGESLPQNTSIDSNGMSFRRELDCKVVMRLHQFNEEQITLDLAPSLKKIDARAIQTHPNYIDSVRGMFPEGSALYPTAGFRLQNHIQLCIRNPNCILGFFSPRASNTWYKKY